MRLTAVLPALLLPTLGSRSAEFMAALAEAGSLKLIPFLKNLGAVAVCIGTSGDRTGVDGVSGVYMFALHIQLQSASIVRRQSSLTNFASAAFQT